MKRIFPVLIAITLTLLLQGCMNTRPDQPTHQEAPSPPQASELATVYLLFDAYIGDRIEFYVDGQHYFKAFWSSYSWIQLPPGEHEIKADYGFWDKDAVNSESNKPAVITGNLEAGETYYISLGTSRAYLGKSASIVNGVFSIDSHYGPATKAFKVLSAKKAEDLMQFYVYIPGTLKVD